MASGIDVRYICSQCLFSDKIREAFVQSTMEIVCVEDFFFCIRACGARKTSIAHYIRDILGANYYVHIRDILGHIRDIGKCVWVIDIKI